MSAESSTLVQPPALYLGTLTILRPGDFAATRTLAPVVTHRIVEPAAPPRTALEPLVDAVLQLLWALVGVYVWVVLLIKGPPARRVRELEPIIWPEADYPAAGLPALGLMSSG